MKIHQTTVNVLVHLYAHTTSVNPKQHLKVLVAEFSLSSSDECGIVAQISEPLATADIPAYYISTFKFDHALVSLSTHHFPITKYSASKGEV